MSRCDAMYVRQGVVVGRGNCLDDTVKSVDITSSSDSE